MMAAYPGAALFVTFMGVSGVSGIRFPGHRHYPGTLPA